MARWCSAVIAGTAVLLGCAIARAAAPPDCTCAGDCNRDGRVTVAELVVLVKIDLGVAPTSACDCLPQCSGPVCIPGLPWVATVNNALYGCPAPATTVP